MSAVGNQASPAVDWLSFHLDRQNDTFEIKEPCAELVTVSWNKPEAEIELPNIPYIRFVNSQFRSLTIGGSASFIDCRVETIQAIGNVCLRDSEVTEVSTSGEVGVFNCTGLKKITASRTYTNLELSGKIYGNVTRILGVSAKQAKKISLCIPERASVASVTMPKNVATLIIDNGTCRGNVVFPEDSIFPEEERVVILINGGKLGGVVVRGSLCQEAQNSQD